MKSYLLTCCAAAALLGAAAQAMAEDQTPAAPAGTKFAPAPTVQEELVYLRDIIALQTLRLDEAEQALARQNEFMEAQSQKIASLERLVVATQEAQQTLAAASSVNLPARTVAASAYTVKSGDTLGAIASDQNVTIAALADANNLKSPYPLKIGQKLKVPGAAGQPASAAEPAQNAAPAQVMAEKIESQQTPPPAQPKPQKVAAAQNPPGPSPEDRPDVTERAIAERRKEEDGPEKSNLPQEVGIRPEDENERPYLAVLSDVGGILTPKGTMFAEPAVDFTTTSDNRFFFQGVEIIDAILIGAIEATDSDRRAVTESMALRYGLTNRIEIDGRLSYLQRDDRVSGVAIDDSTASTRQLSGNGIGDAEMGLHYQLNRGRKFPFAIANIRAKAPTGQGPFEVARDNNGLETELATGSGYWTIEPSVTFILPTDPAVIFANIGYQANLPTSPNVTVGGSTILRTDPGDAIRTSIGVGLSLNERLSLNFGYDQSQFFSTLTETQTTVRDGLFDDVGEPILDAQGNQLLDDPRTIFPVLRQPSTTVGSFLFGGSYAVNDRLRLNLNAAFGATDEAPDMRISLRAQIRLFD